jgi:hypothetical protein
MTAPRRATQRYSERLYQVVDPATGQARDVPGASSLAKVLAAPGLERWKLGRVADAILVEGIRDRDQAIRSVYGPTEAAQRGSEIHAAIEAAILGEPYDELYESAVRRWRGLVAEHDLIVHSVERTVAHASIGYAGTLDQVVEHDGRFRVLDLKTGKGVWPEVAIQLAALANAQGWLAADGTIEPFELPLDTEVAYVAHIPDTSARSDLIPVRLDRVWPVVSALVEIWRWQKTSKLDIGDALPSRLTERRRELLNRARALPEDLAAQLRADWPLPGVALKSPDGWAHQHLDTVEAALRPLEIAAWDRKTDAEKAAAIRNGHLPLERRAPKERLDELAARLAALHPRTRASLQRRAQEVQLPHLALHQRWTPEQADLLDEWITEAEARRAAKNTKKAS